MKKLLIILSLIGLLQVEAYEKFDLLQTLDTVINELSEAQRELSITHDFSERQIYINRNIMTMYIELMNEQIIESFLESYSQMATTADSVQSELDLLEEGNWCIDRIRNRYSLQVQRFGTALSGCVRNSYNEILSWTTYTDDNHESAKLLLNQIQNLGLVSLTERTVFDSTDSFYTPINRGLRNILSLAVSFQNDFEEFARSVVESEEEILEELTLCDRNLVNAFISAANLELNRARDCPPNV